MLSEGPKPRAGASMGMGCFALCWLMISLPLTVGFMGMGLWITYRNLRAQSWPVTTGELIETRVEEHDSRDEDGHPTKTYTPIARYRYAVNGKGLESNRLTPDGVQFNGSQAVAQARLAAVQSQRPLRVRYDPIHPDNAALFVEPHAGFLPLIWGLGFFLIFVVAIGCGALLPAMRTGPQWLASAPARRWAGKSLCVGISLLLTGLSGFLTAIGALSPGVWQWLLSAGGVLIALQIYQRVTERKPPVS